MTFCNKTNTHKYKAEQERSVLVSFRPRPRLELDLEVRTTPTLTSNKTPLPSTLARTLPFTPLSPPNLIFTNPVPTLSQPFPTNRLMAPRASKAVSSPSSPTPCSINVGSEGIVGAGASSLSPSPPPPPVEASAAGVGTGTVDDEEVASSEEAEAPNQNDEETDRLGAAPEAAPKEKLGVPPGRR